MLSSIRDCSKLVGTGKWPPHKNIIALISPKLCYTVSVLTDGESSWLFVNSVLIIWCCSNT